MLYRLLIFAALAVILTGCRSGSDKGGASTTVREPRDPRTVPSATVPAQVPSPIAAIDLAAQGRGATRGPTAGPEVYVVKPGDTLGAISTELGVSVDDLVRANQGIDPAGLRIGQQLRVPRPGSPSPTATATATRGPGASPIATATRAGSPLPTASATRTGAGTPASTGTSAVTPGATRTPTSTAGAASTPARTATAAPAPAANTYTVQAGDTGCAIAAQLGVPVTALATANGTTLEGLTALRVGQTLQVPATRGPAGC